MLARQCHIGTAVPDVALFYPRISKRSPEILRSIDVILKSGEVVHDDKNALSETAQNRASGDVGATDAPGGGGHPWGFTSPSPPEALGWVVNPHPLGSAARGGVGMPGGESECPTP